MSSLVTTLVLMPLGISSIASNDWNTPCFTGHCSWDIPQAAQRAAGNLHIWGSSQAISDITPAAGWVILDCDANSRAQDIRLVCKGNETETGCNHLLDDGMVGKIVRLPEKCGAVPFARVANTWIPQVQNVSGSQVAKLVTSPSPVRAISLDTNFSALDASQYGSVSFAVQLTNSPVTNPESVVASKRRSIDDQAFQRRSFFEGATRALNARDLLPFNITNSIDLPSINYDESVNLFNGSLPNGVADVPGNVTIDADVDAHLHMAIKLGVVIVGTIVPPTLDQAAVFAELNGNINSTLHVKASGKADITTPAITLTKIALDNFDIADIVQIGPDFKLTAQVSADLQLGLDAKVGLSYNVDDVALVFPPNQGKSSASAIPGSSNSPTFSFIGSLDSLGADANVTAHLIPALDVSVSVLGQGATVTLAVDTSATVALNGTVQSNGDKGNGCVDVRTGIDIYADASASLFGIFDVEEKFDIFEDSFDLYNQCFANGGSNSTTA
ncbi:hypothetical protein OF83DRAFT_1169793 [Amylostereum chailletii]|nr:hypothetical protein OF83DRAFT_1169793 [Amylostereum chailletii]